MPKAKVEKPAKTRAKSTGSSGPVMYDEKFTGPEPSWDTDSAEKYDDATFDARMRCSLNWYNYYYTVKTSKKYVVEWLRKSTELTKEQISSYDRSADKYTSMTACGLVLAHRRGMPLKQKHTDFIVRHVHDVLRRCINDVYPDQEQSKPVETKVVITIQDRLNEKLSEFIGEFEGRMDDVITKKVDTANASAFFKTNNVPQVLINKIRDHFKRKLDQFTELKNNKDAYVKESYRHFKMTDWRRLTTWIEGLMQDCEAYAQLKKAARKPRTTKTISREKIAGKLSFLKEDTALKIASIKPTDIIGSKELWCFNTQTRKIYRYVADDQVGTLGIKGTSIVGFDPTKSVGKTLRKPAEQLKDFFKAGKIALRTFLSKIKATETMANGRINQYTLLLRVG